MKNLSNFVCLFLILLSGATQAQKVKIYQAKIYHYDQSTIKGIAYDVNPQGIVMLDRKAVAAMSAKDIQEAILNSQLPSFTVPFEEIQVMNITRRRSGRKGFGIGYVVSFITLETIMAANILSSDKTGCDGSRVKASLYQALIGASCAAPPGIFFNGIAAMIGGGIGSIVGSIPIKQIRLDFQNPEMDARAKLKKYALLLQRERAVQ